ncbi:MAG: 6-carboxytetrahydropterin synthase [Spirochaetales bacterium]
MFELGLKRDFIARHALLGVDGPEGQLHSHHFVVEWTLSGRELNEQGYLVDLLELEAVLDRVTDGLRDRVLNDEPEFLGLNPSVEHLARILAARLRPVLLSPTNATRLASSTIKVWEHERAWASWQEALPPTS